MSWAYPSPPPPVPITENARLEFHPGKENGMALTHLAASSWVVPFTIPLFPALMGGDLLSAAPASGT